MRSLWVCKAGLLLCKTFYFSVTLSAVTPYHKLNSRLERSGYILYILYLIQLSF